MTATLTDIDEFRRQARAWIEGNLERRSDVADTTTNADLTAAHERAFREEAAAYVTPDLGVAGSVTYGPIARSLLAHATPEFLQRHIPRILSAEEIWCQFYSEPEAGSDLAGIRTRALRDGDHWILNGSKIWSSGAHYADWAMCLARTDWDAPKHRC